MASPPRLLKRLSGFSPEGAPPEILPLDYAAAPLWMYVTSKVERKSRVFSCRKEPWTTAWLDTAVQPGEVVYDIGANVGAYTLVAAHRVGPDGTVVAFEPGYASFAHLCDNLVLNDFADRVVPVPLPLAATSHLGRFTYHKLYPGHARHTVEADPSDPAADPAAPVFAQRALATRLDDLVRTFGLPAPHHLKLDVDGAETGILDGATALLANPILRDALIEVDVENTDAVTSRMRDAGFTLQARHQRTREDGTPSPLWYGVFARR